MSTSTSTSTSTRSRTRTRTLGPSIQDAFDPRANSLNFIRLLLATGVLLRHAYVMLDSPTGIIPLESFMRSSFVDGFFAISGFLIVRSWMRNPSWRSYLAARCFRILPAFWVCLIVTALVISPLYSLMIGHPFSTAFWSDSVGYIWRNWFLWIFQEGIDGTPVGYVPLFTGEWNGSLWTLAWEFMCYIAVLALGLLGLLRYRWLLVAAFVGCALLGAVDKELFPSAYFLHHFSRFSTMFLAGAVIYLFRTRIPARAWLLPIAAAIVFVSGWLPDYRVVAALPLAYLCIVSGALLRSPRLRLKNDVSYGVYIYGYPVQQFLIGAGLTGIGVPAFLVLSIVGVLPLALASWFLVERPGQQLRHKIPFLSGPRREPVLEPSR